MGRFINRDPIEEKGGLNLYGFCRNNAINKWDYNGLIEVPDWFNGSEDDYAEYVRQSSAINPYDDGSDGSLNWIMDRTGGYDNPLSIQSADAFRAQGRAYADYLDQVSFQRRAQEAAAKANADLAYYRKISVTQNNASQMGSGVVSVPSPGLSPERAAQLQQTYPQFSNPLSAYNTPQEAMVAGALRAASIGGAFAGDMADWRKTYEKNEYVWGVTKRFDGKFISTIATTNGMENNVRQDEVDPVGWTGGTGD